MFDTFRESNARLVAQVSRPIIRASTPSRPLTPSENQYELGLHFMDYF